MELKQFDRLQASGHLAVIHDPEVMELQRKLVVTGNETDAARIGAIFGEKLLQSGERQLGARYLKAAWETLDQPEVNDALVSAYARALLIEGNVTTALDTFTTGIAHATTPEAVQRLRGNRAIVLLESGQREEGLNELDSVIANSMCTHEDRKRFKNVCATVRDPKGSTASDWTDPRIGAIAQALASTSANGQPEQYERIKQAIDELRKQRHTLSTVERLYLAIFTFQITAAGGNIPKAAQEMRDTVRWARDRGEYLLAEQAMSAGHGFGLVDVDLTDRPLLERFRAAANRSMAPLTGSTITTQTAKRCLEMLKTASELARAIRPNYLALIDREQFATSARRVSEAVISCAVALGDARETFDGCEQLRAQGHPQPSNDSSRIGVTPLLQITAQKSTSAYDIDVESAKRMIAGTTACWWWTTEIVDHTVVSVIVDPNGHFHMHTEELTETLRNAIVALGSPLASITDLEQHPLVGDQAERLPELLNSVAPILPPLLRTALPTSTQTQTIIWSAPGSLAQIPISLVSIGDAKLPLIHYANIVLAPPPSNVQTSSTHSTGPQHEVLVLGPTKSLHGNGSLATALGLRAQDVVGDQTHIDSGVASVLSGTESVLRRLTVTRDLAVIYAHIGPTDPLDSMSIGLELFEESLTTSSLLRSSAKAPKTVLLVGCESLGPSSSGTGEWWSLATGFLSIGATTIIGSTFKPMHSTLTMRFVTDLVAKLRTEKDPRLALRNTQLEWMQRWKADSHYTPHTWAGWIAIGRNPDNDH